MQFKHHDQEYLDAMRTVLETGVVKGDRTGTGTISRPFMRMDFDLSDDQIPLLTTKKMHTRSIIHEIIWYMSGDTNVKYLQENGVRIWNEWADENGDLGPVYGLQWRRWPKFTKSTTDFDSKNLDCVPEFEEIDQVARAIQLLKDNPTDRRIIISGWNVGMLDEMALPPCHAFFQMWSDGEYLRSHLYQRSADFFLGVPFNIVQYSMMTHMFAQLTGLKAASFSWTGGDCHVYSNHIEQCKTQLDRYDDAYSAPKLKLNPNITNIDDFTFDDFEIVGYKSHDTIKAPVAI